MSSLIVSTLSALGQISVETQFSNEVMALSQDNGPWRPPQWTGNGASTPLPTLVITASVFNSQAWLQQTLGAVNVPALQGSSGTQSQATGQQQVIYIFDGMLRAEHEQRAVPTLNPVQTGTAITDHIYLTPATLTVEIAMSDMMQSYVVGQFGDLPSRSVSAYQTLLSLQAAKQTVAVSTRLNTYPVMAITMVSPVEEANTRYALRCRVTFTQIIMAAVQQPTTNGTAAANGTSALPNTTDSSVGQAGTSQPSSVLLQNNNVHNFGWDTSAIPDVSNAGNWTSTGSGAFSSNYGNLPGISRVLGGL